MLLIAEFAYNNAKNTSIGYMSFNLDFGFYTRASHKENVDPCSYSKSTNELANELKKLMTVYKENLQHTQEL